MKKKFFIPLSILIILVGIFYAFKRLEAPSPAGDPSPNDCRLRCEDKRSIPCKDNEDCRTDPMRAFCRQKTVIFKNGFEGYCKDGYCQAYGCGGAPSID